MRRRRPAEWALIQLSLAGATRPGRPSLRAIRQMTDGALRQLSPQFEAIYATSGRPSVPPEQLLRALLLQALYTVRSERLLVEAACANCGTAVAPASRGISSS